MAIRKHDDDDAKVYGYIFEHYSDAASRNIVPADKNYAILNAVVLELEKYEIHYPKVDL